uniref:uncharacterized protein LOC100183774 isoform X2 n=1 Tax=Ciona intestinalis TaxID=7719 RepID=UPI000180EEEC|nr:uncharacterized protein LOC100183774 isoform X2 [Ciona intestinalis]|eukprot:XP_002127983.2 uncharacterized protein LOC100183774 isoform X2 [Ciona intestinalis]
MSILGNQGEFACVPREAATDFIVKCITAAGATTSHATDLAELLVAADYRGHFSHGMNRLEMYVKDLKTGICDVKGEPVVEKETVATAMVDGGNLLGPAVGKFCMNLAIKKASEAGVGWVCARRSNHYSIAGYYGLMAAEKSMIGFSFTNTTPTLFIPRSNSMTLGTNPICCVAPAKDGDSFALDMATTTVAFGKVEVAHRKGENIPNGWGADPQGRETNDPTKVLNGGGLLPLGGSEIGGGYKGYGLAMMVEVMCGVLAGAHYGKNIRRWGTTERIADLGQCFIAVDPKAFFPGFEERLQDFIDSQRNLEPSDPNHPVLVAGDPERIHMKKCDDMGGIPYPKNVVEYMNGVANKLGVSSMTTINPKV